MRRQEERLRQLLEDAPNVDARAKIRAARDLALLTIALIMIAVAFAKVRPYAKRLDKISKGDSWQTSRE